MSMKHLFFLPLFFTTGFSFGQNNELTPELNAACECFTQAIEREGEVGYDYKRAFDNCLYALQKELVKTEPEKYKDIQAVFEYASAALDKTCTYYYRSELVRSVLGNFKFVTTGAKPVAQIDPSTWYCFEGLTDTGDDLEVQIRFIAKDTFEYVIHMQPSGSTEVIYTNDIAYYDSGATKFFTPVLQVFLNKDYSMREPLQDHEAGYTDCKRFNHVYHSHETDYHTNERSEAMFFFNEGADIKAGFYIELEMDRWNPTTKKDDKIYKEEAINTSLKFVKTIPFTTESSRYFQKIAIADTMCNCIERAVQLDKTEKFDLEENLARCSQQLAENLFEYDTSYNEPGDARRFENSVIYYDCPWKKTADSLVRNYTLFNGTYESTATEEECKIMNSGIFMLHGDKDSALISIDEKKYTITYGDGTKTIYTIQWLDARTFELTFIKSNNHAFSNTKKGSRCTYQILRVENEFIYYQWKEQYFGYNKWGKFVKLN